MNNTTNQCIDIIIIYDHINMWIYIMLSSIVYLKIILNILVY
jgi:hypothetical protein